MFYQQFHLGTPDYFKKECGENFSFPPHLHQCFELLLIIEGQMNVQISNKNYSLHAGECILIFPNQIHALQSEKSKHILFIFSPKIVQAYTFKKENLMPESNTMVLDSYLTERLKTLSENASAIEIKGILYMVCSEFDKTAAYKSACTDNGLLSKIFAFVDANYNKECTLKKLSHFLGYDYAYISRLFKEITGISYNNYLNICRLNNAGYLLQNSNKSILECAYLSGYNCLRSFNRNFKQYYGISPTEYRTLSDITKTPI